MKSLNERFSELIDQLTIFQSYEKIVNEKPYKILSCYVYDWGFAPLKRGQLDDLKKPMSPKLIKNKAAKKSYTPAKPTRDDPTKLKPSESSTSCTEGPSIVKSELRDIIKFTEAENSEFTHASHRLNFHHILKN